ncbi:hypothetical protein C6P45_000601 [Maudiozyma exigua]|uniref:Uncharacterized protein n=1 Tax=Maudiozyma exigua TaxID=34358 RepID=A0A9P6WGE6_MAUEX|nr:hypothetical protein C6P45_000601 [Kazachstania exigua]
MKHPWDLPNLLKRYPAIPGKKSFAKLERQVIANFISKEYQIYTREYNVFYLYRQVPLSGRNIVNSDTTTEKASSQLLWKRYNESVGSLVRIIDKPLQNRIFRQIIDPKLSADLFKRNSHVGFQSIASLDQLLLDDSFLRYNNDTVNTVETYMLGIRLNTNKYISGLDEIEPLLEETSNMYKNLDYKSLLEIAKKNRKSSQGKENSGVTLSNRNVVKKFLDRLALSKIVYPLLTSNSQWLIFTTSNKNNSAV